MKCWSVALVSLIMLGLFLPSALHSQEKTVSVGYGIGLLNPGAGPGKLMETRGYYDFVQFSYSPGKTLTTKVTLLFEPFVSIVNRPVEGVDAGLGLSLKYSLFKQKERSPFISLGTGAAYSSLAFAEQDSNHLFFILQGSMGYRWDSFFAENRFKHYSNGGIHKPNKSINSNMLNLGVFF